MVGTSERNSELGEGGTRPQARSVVIFGASGFLGRAVLQTPWPNACLKAVSRTRHADALTGRNITRYSADLAHAESLRSVLARGDTVINLAYDYDAPEAKNMELAENLLDACAAAGVARLVHCSTAVVVGRTRQKVVTERTVCEPVSSYQRTKLKIEERIRSAQSESMDVGVLRPTAIVGPGGENLRKLSDSLLRGSPLASYVRACLFGTRPMHLVPVRDVAAALRHLVFSEEPLSGNVYIVSADDEPDNNFRDVERHLRNVLGIPPRRLPVLRLPAVFLELVLSAARRPDTVVRRKYDSSKLRDTNFVRVDSVASAVRDFGTSLSMTFA